MEDKFLLSYNEVFNKDGSIKCCGREKCKELLQSASDFLDSYNVLGIPRNKLGNTETGFVNCDLMHTIYAYASTKG